MDDDCEIDYKDGGFDDDYGGPSAAGSREDHQKARRQFYKNKAKKKIAKNKKERGGRQTTLGERPAIFEDNNGDENM